MKAAVVDQYGVPSYGDFDEPTQSGRHRLVQVLAAGLNNVDVVTARGGLPTGPVPPFVAGREGVGMLDGRRVYFDGPVAPFGSMAERTLVDPAGVYDVPDGLSDGMAVSIGIAGLAAWVSLTWRAELQPGETVLVLGASGVVGQVAVQASRLLGAGRVVGAARSPGAVSRTLQLGADAAVALDDDSATLGDRLTDACEGGADVVIDLLGGPLADVALKACATHARYVQVGNLAGAGMTLTAPLVRERMLNLLGYTTRRAPSDVVAAAYAAMAGLAGRGELVVPVEEIPLSDVASAWQRLAASTHHKLLLRP